MSLYDVARFVINYMVFPLFKVELVGTENLPESGPVILCSNHTSALDPLFIAAAYKRDIRFMAKKELFKIPVVGSVVKGLRAIAVDRGANDMSAIRASLAALKEGEPLGIFPEGHRFRDGKLHEFQNGTALLVTRSKAPVVPLRVTTGYRLFRKVRIVFGKPFTYEMVPGVNGSEQLAACTQQIWERVNELK